MFTKYRLLALVVIMLVLAIAAGGAPGVPVADASHSWGSYHWARSSNPVQLQVGDNVSSIWDSHLQDAIADWNGSSVLALTLASGQAKGKCRPTDGRIEVCNDAYGNNGWLGVAQIWASGEHITQATAKMNDTYFGSAPYNTGDWRQFVMCQEIGHDFGLDHQDENFNNANLGTCMDYTSDPSTNQHPNDHDYQQLASIYSHLDGGGGNEGPCRGGPKQCGGNHGIPDSDFSTPGEWGQLVRAEGRIAVYERDFGNNQRLITFVIWAN